MLFLSTFLRTISILSALLIFIIIIGLLSSFATNNIIISEFKHVEGDENSENKIAVLNLSGLIADLDDSFYGEFISTINPKRVEVYLEELLKIKPKVLIVKINSPGGTVNATEKIYKSLKEFKKSNGIDIYFFSDQLITSGAYWIAMSGNNIYADYGTLIGSIGVRGPDWIFYNKPKSISNGIFGKSIDTIDGIEIYSQSSGYSKDIYNPFRKPSEAELIHLKSIIDDIYEDFLFKVSKNRKIEINVLKNEIGGLIYNSKQAVINNLIDDKLDLNELIKKINKEFGFSNYSVIENSNQISSIKKYVKSFFNTSNINLCDTIRYRVISILPSYLSECLN